MDGEKSTGKTIAIVALTMVCLVLIGLQFFQNGASKPGEIKYETFTGVAEDSFEYSSYKSCVSSCAKCEINCKDSMFRQISMMKNDESMCAQISEEFARTDCTNNINNAKALAGKDKSYCEKITDELRKTGCISAVVLETAVEQENVALCDQVPEDYAQGCKQSWYSRMAMKKLDESYCSQLADEWSKTSCKNGVSMAKQMQATMPIPIQEAGAGNEGNNKTA